ncbi:hypothetical protein NC653_003749 [Populus alba x Populus x berolinensis]|uniref:Uncharacterized protein n=1 Tax=Populus alba x Populus x berolinensis TaxID=444605 RepID=A0AAD6RSA5_9ROSI|nr:hypothetical protein NC653_003749 [Populus alba x Populus x berolinensis]
MKKQKLKEKPKKNSTFKTVHYIDSGDDNEEIKEDIALITTKF